MKKKTIAALAAGVLVVGMIPAALFASSQNTAQQPVDINGNGVSHHNSMRCEQYIDVNQEGTCNRYGTVCNGFIDEDGDGVCDNRSIQGCGNAREHHGGHGHDQGRGCA